MAKSKQRKFYVVSIIVSFILSVLLSIGGYLVGADMGIFNKDTIYKSMSAAGYYNGIYEDVVSTSKQLGRPMMLHAEVFENVFYYNEVKDDIQNNLEAQLAGTMYTPDTSQIRERLNSNIEDYARKNNIEIGTQQQTAIDGFLTQIEDNYKSSLGITFINYYVSMRKMFDNIYFKVLAAILVLIMIAVFIIIKDHRYVHRAIRYITYSTLAAAYMTGIIPMYLYIKGIYRRLAISPAYYYNMLIKTADKSLLMFVYSSIFLLVLSAGLIALTIILKNNLKKKASHSHTHHSHHSHHEAEE